MSPDAFAGAIRYFSPDGYSNKLSNHVELFMRGVARHFRRKGWLKGYLERMKKIFRSLNLVIFLALLAGCAPGGNGGIIPGISYTPTPLPTAPVTIIPAPDAQAAMRVYMDAFKAEDYAAMYALLAKSSRDAITQDDFAKRHRDALNSMSAKSFDYEVTSSLLSPYNAQVAARVAYHTVLVGDITRDIVARMNLEEGAWKVQWDESLIMAELLGGNVLVMDYDIPARGDVYDRSGNPLVTQADTFAFGITPGQINFDIVNTLVTELSKLCGIYPDDIVKAYTAAGADWYLPMCEGTKEEAERLLAINPGGLVVTPYNTRYYHHQGLASQITGYTLSIPPEELDAYRRMGYRGSERVGQAGIEKWAEDYLAGQHGGRLYVSNPATGQIITALGQSDPQPASSVYLTIDSNMQFYAEYVLRDFVGAIVVLERDTGRVLAMASSPTFDPNLFDPLNINSGYQLNSVLNDARQPFVNRAAQEQYPLGSVFKVITFSAGLESGLYLPETTYDCQYDFTELQQYGGPVLHDWTWDHCQDNIRLGLFCDTSSTMPSGLLNYSEGLMRSCNPYFWHIGLDLFNNNRAADIMNMAHAFGLGAPTGIDQIAESPGQILTPVNPIEATNQAIGQGDVLVTPLQVASFIAAVGNGGTLYRPQVVEKIQPIEGPAIVTFKPEARGTLPLRADNLLLLQDALKSVVENPRGTANFRLRGLTIPVAGKTGTAETGGVPHAWFAGYTMNQVNSNMPDIAIAVVIEDQGQGSDYAAPLFRAMVETYYYGAPQARPWFGPIGGPNFTATPLGGVPTRTPKR